MSTDKLDQYGRKLITSQQGINILLSGRSIDHSLFVDSDDLIKYNTHVEAILGLGQLNKGSDLTCKVDEFHEQMSNQWFTPEPFASIDVTEYVVSLCKTDAEMQRVAEELIMFDERGLYDLLRFLIYFVDYMRKNKLVWGVGRGSSVASYVLFLIGVHKVDSIKYDLDIKEFLK